MVVEIFFFFTAAAAATAAAAYYLLFFSPLNFFAEVFMPMLKISIDSCLIIASSEIGEIVDSNMSTSSLFLCTK